MGPELEYRVPAVLADDRVPVAAILRLRSLEIKRLKVKFTGLTQTSQVDPAV
jgi:hypothetical protein